MYSGGMSMPPPGPVYSLTNAHTASMQLAMNTSFNTTQMQTPPPTRGTSARKPQDQQIAFGTPSTIVSRRYLTPQQASNVPNHAGQAQYSPMQFPQLQFSPDVYQFNDFGPASAPAAPHAGIMWGQAASPAQQIPSATLDDPFAPGNIDMSWQPARGPTGNAQDVSFDTPAMDSFPVQAPHPQSVPLRDISACIVAENVVQSAPAVVNPALVYSSPIRPVARSSSRTKKPRQQQEQMPPAEASLAQTRQEVASSTSAPAVTSLRRHNTTGTSKARSSTMSSEPLSRNSSISGITRTASPVKRHARPSLGSISESRSRHRASVILMIDENGRARTETRPAEVSPSRSVRDRYPALFDSDSSDVESDTSEKTPSRRSSFKVDKRDDRRAKAARLDPPVENLEGLTIPRSSSAASMKSVAPSRAAVAAAAQLRRQGSLRRSTPSRNQNRKSMIPTTSGNTIDTCPLDMFAVHEHTETGAEDASISRGWSASGESRQPAYAVESTLEAHNRRWSMMSFEQQMRQSVSPQHNQTSFTPEQPQYHRPAHHSRYPQR